MQAMETGTFDGTVPYIKDVAGDEVVVVFPGSMELLISVLVNPEQRVKDARTWIPPACTACLLGYGGTIPPSGATDVITDRFARFVREQVGKPVTVAGISFGGFVAISFAARHPELVKKLVLLVGAHDVSESGKDFFEKSKAIMGRFTPGNEQELKNFIDIYKWLLHDPLIKLVAGIVMKRNKHYFWNNITDTTNGFNAYSSIINRDIDYKALLPRITAPAHVVGGTRDKVFSTSIYEEAARLLPDARLHLMRGAGHMLMVEQRKRFATVMHGILAKNI